MSWVVGKSRLSDGNRARFVELPRCACGQPSRAYDAEGLATCWRHLNRERRFWSTDAGMLDALWALAGNIFGPIFGWLG